MPTLPSVVSTSRTELAELFCTWKPVSELVEFLKVVAPPTAMVAWFSPSVSRFRLLTSLVPRVAAAPKLLPPWTKTGPEPPPPDPPVVQAAIWSEEL
jgi:hypothetical protein